MDKYLDYFKSLSRGQKMGLITGAAVTLVSCTLLLSPISRPTPASRPVAHVRYVTLTPVAPVNSETLPAMSIEERISQYDGIPYRDWGYMDDNGNYVYFKGAEPVPQAPGFNCAGYQLQLARELTGIDIGLYDAFKPRPDTNDKNPDRPWYGLDLVLNIMDATGGRIVDEAEGYRPWVGYPLSSHQAVEGAMKPGYAYMIALSNTNPSRKYSHQLTAIRTDKVVIYEASSSGIQRTTLAEVAARGYWQDMFVVEVPLP